MTGWFTMHTADGPEDVDVPVSGGENVMVPIIRAVVRRSGEGHSILLQRRDSARERVRGAIEIPGGRWRAGESPVDAITREVHEETGVTIESINGIESEHLDVGGTIASIEPLVVVAGVHGAFPGTHLVVTATGSGTPRPEPGESTDVRWWPLDDVRTEMESNKAGFIPSTYAALEAYLAGVDAGS